MSWVIAFLGFCALIVLHELGHFTAAKMVGMRVERFALFFPPLIARKTIGETEYAIGSLPLGGYVKISGMSPAEELPEDVRDRAYHAQPPWKRIVVIAAGPAVNFVLAFLLLVLYFGVYGPRTETTNLVSATEKNYPAANVLKPDDKVLSIDGKTGGPAEFQKVLLTKKCDGAPTNRCRTTEPVTVVVDRDGERKSFTLTPIYDAQAEPPRPRLGFGYQEDNEPVPFSTALRISTESFWLVTKETFKLPAKLIDPVERKQLSGVVGTYETTRQSILDEPRDAIAILALISLSLAIVNLFPFLPLDGGHIFWAVVEKVRGKPVSLKVMEKSSFIGFALVIVIFAIGLQNDLGRIGDEGFKVR